MMNNENKKKISERENLNDDKGFEITSHEVELDQNEEDKAISYEIKIGGGD